ncbi:YcnI family protein [Arthrobacter roseus]|uniref:YcnI family copper-binding membrane protein n=1 Tax=Arthrobacter roseus TaxID=136274 RepID=UPI0019635698|nr:YcnI family protein [Arthrobacter roseus]MBM7847581.1 uncharacterized protein YcnI [Arthrobacter roseus]
MQIRRTLLASVATLGLMTAGVASASAHVTVTPDSTDAGAYSVLTFAASHGCEDSPTTSFTIDIPDTIADAKPTVYAGWDVKKVEEKLDEPLTLEDGSSITKHVGKIVYTPKTPLEDGYRMALEVQIQNPDKSGETLAFPVLQKCAEGETDWSEMPAEGQDPHELEAPAPSYTLTEATEEDHHAASGTEEDAEATGNSTERVSADDDASPVPGYLGLGAVVLGLIVGGIALARTRTSTK